MDRVLPPWTAPGGRRMPVRAPGWPRHARAAPARSTCRRERKAHSMRQQPRRRGRAVRTARGARHRRPCRRWPATVGPARTATRSRGRRRRPAAVQRRDRRTVANRSGTAERTGCRTARKIRPPDRGPTTSMRQGKTARPPGKRFVPCLTANKGRIGSDTHERHGGRARKAPPDWHVRRDGIIPTDGATNSGAKKTRSEDRALLAARGVRLCLPHGCDQRCVAMVRACAAALFSAATGGTLPSKASVSSLFSTGSMRS